MEEQTISSFLTQWLSPIAYRRTIPQQDRDITLTWGRKRRPHGCLTLESVRDQEEALENDPYSCQTRPFVQSAIPLDLISIYKASDVPIVHASTVATVSGPSGEVVRFGPVDL